MNEQPNVQDLPSRDELIRFLGRQKHRIAAVYDADGKQVHLGGRNPGEVVGDGFEFFVGQPKRCAICDAPSGEVTLMKVEAENPNVKALAEAAGIETVGYVCYGGNCAAQRNKAMLRPFVRAARAISTRRFTKSGHAMQWLTDKDGKTTLEYARTSRSAKRIKARRAARKVGHRANRSK